MLLLNHHDVLQETCNNFIQACLEDLIATEGDEKNGENIYRLHRRYD